MQHVVHSAKNGKQDKIALYYRDTAYTDLYLGIVAAVT